jgi:hypothetical protein
MKALNLKKLVAIGAVVLIFGTYASAESGNGGGNGGGAQLCYTDVSKTVEESVESYDLYQGRKILRFNIPSWNGVETKKQITDRVIKKIAVTLPVFAMAMSNVIDYMNTDGLVVGSTNIALTIADGSFFPQTDSRCTYKQMVNWFDPGQYNEKLEYGNIVLRDNDHYSSGPVHMDPLNQAALDVHEAAYKVVRDTKYREAWIKCIGNRGSLEWARCAYTKMKDTPVSDILLFVAQAFSSDQQLMPLELGEFGAKGYSIRTSWEYIDRLP